MQDQRTERRRASRQALGWIAVATIAAMSFAQPAEAVCESIGLAAGSALTSVTGGAGAVIGAIKGSHIGIAAGGTAYAGKMVGAITLGTVATLGTAVVLLATPAVCLALAGNPATLPIIAIAAGIAASGALVIELMMPEEYGMSELWADLKTLTADGIRWVRENLSGTAVEARESDPGPGRAEHAETPFVGPIEFVGPIARVPAWVGNYSIGFDDPGQYSLFPGVTGTGSVAKERE